MAVLNYIAVGLFVIGLTFLLNIDVKKEKGAFSPEEKRHVKLAASLFAISICILLISHYAG
jgi:nitrate reductase gamma subunit